MIWVRVLGSSTRLVEMVTWRKENLNPECPTELWGLVFMIAARITSGAEDSSVCQTRRDSAYSIPAFATAGRMSSFS